MAATQKVLQLQSLGTLAAASWLSSLFLPSALPLGVMVCGVVLPSSLSPCALRAVIPWLYPIQSPKQLSHALCHPPSVLISAFSLSGTCWLAWPEQKMPPQRRQWWRRVRKEKASEQPGASQCEACASGFQCERVGCRVVGVDGPDEAVEERVSAVMMVMGCDGVCGRPGGFVPVRLSVLECMERGGVSGRLLIGFSVGRSTAGTYRGDLGGRIWRVAGWGSMVGKW